MARPFSALWKEEKWPYRWVSSEGVSFIEARRALLRTFWTIYIPALLLLTLISVTARELSPKAFHELVGSSPILFAVVSTTFGIPAIALLAHSRRVWGYARERTGPGATRVRAYTALTVLSAALMSMAFLISAWLVLRTV